MKIITNSKTIEFSERDFLTTIRINYKDNHFRSANILRGTQSITFFDKNDLINLFNLLEDAKEFVKGNSDGINVF